jgi:4Fe-4S iron-sulfur cluster binding domain/DR2241 stabilising domain
VKIADALESWLDGGGSRVGQLLIRREAARFRLLHHEDTERADLDVSRSPETAREIAKYDDEGKYRPLKSAPNLQHGWELDLEGIGQLRAALDFLYPAAAGAWLWHREGRLVPVPFRRTAGRQSGMYEIVKDISDSQADALAGEFCNSGKCLKIILWKLDANAAIAALPPEKFEISRAPEEFPLLCPEACNLFVAAAQKVVRRSRNSK